MNDIKIQKLIWDSAFFGFEIGKIEISSVEDDESFKNLIEKSSFQMIQIFSKIDLSHLLNLAHVDEKLTYSKKPSNDTKFNNINIRSVCEDLDGTLFKLAKDAGEYSRYNKDTQLKLKFELMYEIWMKKSLERDLADEVFVHKNKDIINGMVTVNKNLKNAEIGLISVDNKVKSKGIGSQLIKFVENWALIQNIENIFVSTQKENYAACQFYEKNKFIIYDTIYIYHVWKKS
jgi:dTDP-4-amino-4,6-dideoxy-D-galactose acyltransferase